MDRRLYRAMKRANDQKPLLGRTARTLGVRVQPHGEVSGEGAADVYPDCAGYISPGRGMSVAMDDPSYLPRHRKPRSLGGEGRDPVFALRTDLITGALSLFEDAPPHAVIEPSERCRLTSYETALAHTRDSWEPCNV